ncbi:unnamed protein product [Brugia pahangi]|uniref:Ovule protein n=1 Tax=Brugia pahangi TaxID=6280 RepID=A0A0N4T0J9_BRUPA|nr:unnamed protein product [Brugia pahangi]
MKKTKAQPKSVEPILASMHVRCTSIQDSIIIAIRIRFYHIISQLFSTVRTENLWRGKYKSERKCGKERNNATATAYFDTKD